MVKRYLDPSLTRRLSSDPSNYITRREISVCMFILEASFFSDVILTQLLRSVSSVCVLYLSSCFDSNSLWWFSNMTSNFLSH